MAENSFVSILLPVHNGLPHIGSCLDSIIAQTYTNWELIVVNDHSSDRTLELLHQRAGNDTRIKVLENSGHGVITALQTAFEASNGTYITRMDHDDLMPPKRLELMVAKAMNSGKGNVVTGLVNYFSDSGELGGGYRNYESWLNGLSIKEENYSEIYKECVIPSPCWMIHKEDLLQAEAFKPDRYPEDYDLCFRFRQNNYKVCCVPEVLLHWRDHPNRNSRISDWYADNQFAELKVFWFFRSDHNPERPLVLWGAGNKGKALAKLIAGLNVPFCWVSNNPKKQGKHIYDVLVEPESVLDDLENPQLIIAVSGPDDQLEIREYLNETKLLNGSGYFFFFF